MRRIFLELDEPRRALDDRIFRGTLVALALLGALSVFFGAAQAGPFAGKDEVQVDELVTALQGLIPELQKSAAVKADFEAFAKARNLDPNAALFEDYVAVKMSFEATRDAGLWHIDWTITNQNPNAEQIWKQWQAWSVDASDSSVAPRAATATAECDEISALFAGLAHSLGAEDIGLLWPTWNHTVAVWSLKDKSGGPVRVVVPTTQIFLSNDDRFGTDGFDAFRQRTIYDYKKLDAPKTMPGPLADFFFDQIKVHMGKSELELQEMRNKLDLELH